MKSMRRQLHEENGATTAQVVALVSVVVVLLFAIVMAFRSGGGREIAESTDRGLINQTELFEGRGQLPPGINGNAQIGLGDGNGQGGNDTGNPDTGSGSTVDGSGTDSSSGGFSDWLRNWKTVFGGEGGGNPLGAVGDFFVDAGSAIVDGVVSLANGVKSAWDGLPNPVKGIIVGLVVGIAVAVVAALVIASAPLLLLAAIVGAGVIAGGLYGWSVRDSEFSILSAASWAFMASGSVATLGMTHFATAGTLAIKGSAGTVARNYLATFTWSNLGKTVVISNGIQAGLDLIQFVFTQQPPYSSFEEGFERYLATTLTAMTFFGIIGNVLPRFNFLHKLKLGDMRGYGNHPFVSNVVKPLHGIVTKIPGQGSLKLGTVASWLASAMTAIVTSPLKDLVKSAAVDDDTSDDSPYVDGHLGNTGASQSNINSTSTKQARFSELVDN